MFLKTSKMKSKREVFRSSRFVFEEYDQAAADYYYRKRRAFPREDVRVVACFYYPEAKDTAVLFLPHQYFPPSHDHWAVVCFFGSKDDVRLRGYLPIVELIRSSGNVWDVEKTPKMATILRGTQIGPEKTDTAWSSMEGIPAKYLVDTLPAQAHAPPPALAVDKSTDAEAKAEAEAKGKGKGKGKEEKKTRVDGPGQLDAHSQTKRAELLKPGKKVDFRDDGQWYGARIKSANEGSNTILLSFDRYSAEFDKWVPRDSLALAPYGKFSSKEKANKKKKKTKNKKAKSTSLFLCVVGCAPSPFFPPSVPYGAVPVLRLLFLCGAVCCAVLCCAVLCCAVLCCAVLCCAVLSCAVLCRGVVWCWRVRWCRCGVGGGVWVWGNRRAAAAHA